MGSKVEILLSPVLKNLLVPFSFFGQEWAKKRDGEKRKSIASCMQVTAFLLAVFYLLEN